MKLSNNGLAFVQSFEGYHRQLPDGSCAAYRCQIGGGQDDGKWTIGWGCTVGVTEGMVWTRKQADDAFLQELSGHEETVNRVVTVPMTIGQYDALVSFSYNCGNAALEASSLLRKFNAGDTDGAARVFPLYNKSRGKIVSGLVRRRAAEAALFLRPDGPSGVPDMPQAIDPPPVEPEGSRKVAVANAGQIVAGAGTLAIGTVSASDGFGYAERAAAFAKTYGPGMAIAFMLLAAFGFAAIKYFARQDYHNGTWTPSGASK